MFSDVSVSAIYDLVFMMIQGIMTEKIRKLKSSSGSATQRILPWADRRGLNPVEDVFFSQ